MSLTRVNPIPHPFSPQIGACLKINKSLQRLDLDYNKLGPKSLAAIAVGLQANSSLASLSLEHNPITGEDPAANSDLSGVAALSEAIKTNASLFTLNLYQIGLTQAGGHLLADGVVSSRSLRCVLLSPHDGVDPADHQRMTARLMANAEARDAAIAASKAERAAARLAEVQAGANKEAVEKEAAEKMWVEGEAASRKAARDQADFETYRRERMAEMDREVAEKARKIRLAEEAAAKEKKAKKK